MKFIWVFVFLPLIKTQSEDLNGKLSLKFTEVTGYNVLNEKYREIKSVKSGPSTNGLTLSNLFTERLEILQKTVKKVEKRMETFVPPELDKESIMWAKSLNKTVCDLQERGSYSRPICLTNSSVHIPIDIFDGDKEMLKTVAWTSMLEEVWINNMRENPDLRWQYFGSTTGVMRFYPGVKWPKRYRDKENKAIDLYDVRRRSWYIEGLSLPKDMLILIDSSGSSQGQALALMKHITRSLLETLDENDNLNVMTFPQDTSDGSRPPCFSTFMKATFRNKQVLLREGECNDAVALDYTKKIISTGIANFSKALEAAFSFFENATTNASDILSTPHCNQMIMLLTDGGNEKPREVLRRYNTFQKVRIFTYLIGPISTDAPAIKWIAEKSRGHFYQIPSIVAIRSQAQDYMRYLSESKINSSNTYTWSSANLDYLNNELVVSITAPLFNKSSGEKESNLTILGVLGMDLPVRQFSDFIPNKLGQYGYFFIINSQGFVLCHPRLQKVREEFLSVDILDLETDVNMEEIRRKMIDGETGKLTVDGFDDLPDEHHANIKRRTYQYEPIPKTEFSLCIVLYDEVMEDTKDTKISGSVDSEIFQTIYDTDVFFNEKDYCIYEEKEENNDEEEGEDKKEEEEEKEGEKKAENKTTKIEEFSELIQTFKCDVDKLKSLIFDINHTESTSESWVKGDQQVFEQEPGVMLVFILTPNIFRTYPINSSVAEDYLLKEYDKYKDRISKTSQWFVTNLDIDTELDNVTTKVLMIARRITNGNVTMAVVGALIHERWLQDLAFSGLVETSVASYLLDDGGFIVTTNLPPPADVSGSLVGQFFGRKNREGEEDIEGEIMNDMVDNKIYEWHRSFGYLASCKDIDMPGFSPSLRSLMPFLELFSPTWWLSVFVSQLAWISSLLQVLLSMLEMVVFGEVKFHQPDDKMESEYCAKVFYKYTFASEAYKDNAHEFDCGNCTKSYKTKMLVDLNLLLVTVTSNCTCDDDEFEPLPYRPQLNTNETLLRSMLYRKVIPCQPYLSEKEETYSSGVRLRQTWKPFCPFVLWTIFTGWRF